MPRPSSDQRIANAISLLTLLSAASEGFVRRSQAMRALGIDEARLQDALSVISDLADRTSGARAIVLEEDDQLALIGDAAQLKPLRLTFEETLALAHVLDATRLPPDARHRIARALLPEGVEWEGADIADAARYGSTYAALAEGIRYGIRCMARYRSAGDRAARERIIDPGYLQAENGGTYLVAWDVEQGGQRRYRLDRLESVAFTEDSVEDHPWRYDTPSESVRTHGLRAHLRWASEEQVRQCPWAVAQDVRADGEGATGEVAYTSEAWLFDRVLAAGGEVVILAPEELRARFCGYARGLLEG